MVKYLTSIRLRKIINYLLDDEYEKFGDHLNHGFNWGMSVQGHGFWNKLYKETADNIYYKRVFTPKEKMEIVGELLRIVEREE